MGFLTAAAARLLRGTPFGFVYPAAPLRPLPDVDARYYALEQLRAYLAALVFSRTGAVGEPAKPFQVPAEDLLIEQPDDPKDLRFPSIGVLPARGTHDMIGLGPASIDESTLDVYAPGTALLWYGDYVEPLMLEVFSAHKAERRALLAGLKIALRPLEQSSSLNLKLPAYFDRIAQFTMTESQYIDDPDVIRGRRRGQIPLVLRVPEVVLVDVVTLKPYVHLETGESVVLDETVTAG